MSPVPWHSKTPALSLGLNTAELGSHFMLGTKRLTVSRLEEETFTLLMLSIFFLV